MSSILGELQRRNVFRVGFAYVVAGWLLLQVADIVLEAIEAPPWVMKAVLLLLALGLPVALIFAWAFEMTPDGIKREKDVDRTQSITARTGQKLNQLVVALLAVGMAFLLFERFSARPVVSESSVTPEPVSAPVQSRSAAAPAAVSVAVLPFDDLSAQGDQAYFADGIAEELLNVLVRVDGLQVASRTSSFAYKDSAASLQEIAEKLRVDHVLEGSVRKSGDRVRITAQLINASTDRHLWSETFDRDLSDIFAIQDEIAKALVAALRDTLGIEAVAGSVAVAASTDNLDAYDLYLKGRSLFLNRIDLEEGIRLLEKAVEIDPEFAKAWESLAAGYLVAPDWDDELQRTRGSEFAALSERSARKALELDDTLSLAWAVLGLREAVINHDYSLGMQYLDKAITADPKNATAWLWHGILLADLGFLERALIDTERCLEIDPAYQNCSRHLSHRNFLLGHNEAAIENFRARYKTGQMWPSVEHIPLVARHGTRLEALYAAELVTSDDAFPHEAWIAALKHPDDDLTVEREALSAYLDNNVVYRDLLVQTSMAAGEWGRLPDFDVIYWAPHNARFRHSAEFKRLARANGLEAYWRANEFPPQCRPLGNDDFECD